MSKRKALAEILAQEQPKLQDSPVAVMNEWERRAALIPTFKEG
jgi:hypothetical protein